MLFENVNFNSEYWKTKTESEFLKSESHHGLSKEQLKEAFSLMKSQKASLIQTAEDGLQKKRVKDDD